MKKIAITVLIFIVCLGLVGCNNKKSKNPIVGTWAYNSNFVYTFNEDKTCQYNVTGTIMKCTYEIEGENLSILYDGDKIPFETTFKIDGNKLEIADSMGSTVTYEKQ